MVSGAKERQDFPAYALDTIKELARRELVSYASWRVAQDVLNLEYDLGNVCQCIANLEAAQFHHAERPANQKHWQDVYHCRWRVGSGAPDDLYLKLIVATSTTVKVMLCSIHRHR